MPSSRTSTREISVTLLLDDRELDLSMREADVAIRLRRPTQPDLIQRKLFTVHHHVYASAEYVRKNGIPTSLADLDKHKIVTFGSAPPYLASINWLETAGLEEGKSRQPVLTNQQCRRAAPRHRGRRGHLLAS